MARHLIPVTQRRADIPLPEPKIPDTPTFLAGHALEIWHETTKLLDAEGLICDLDAMLLAAYCTAVARWLTAEKELAEMGEITKSPNGFPIQNPWRSVANSALKQAVEIGRRFGLTPLDRTKIKRPGWANVPATKPVASRNRFFADGPVIPYRGNAIDAEAQEAAEEEKFLT